MVQGVEIIENGICTIIVIGKYTIAVPNDCPVGVSKRHSDDYANAELGCEIALARMFKDAKDKDLI